MAKKKKTTVSDKAENTEEQSISNEPESKASTPEELDRVKRRNVVITSVVVAIAFSVLGFVGWHRPRDAGRQWYKRAQEGYAQRVEGSIQRCFGASDGASLRRALPDIRRGTLPAQLRNCRGSALTEATASPLAFASSLGPPPGYAENQKLRVIDAVERLRASETAYDRAVSQVTSDGTVVPEAVRDPLASALDQVATDVDGVRNAMRDLGVVVEDNASWY